ncbi:nucleotide exchange factor GrpE [Kineococcus sp. SYSU DK005]|uniref:nucleotide exchange factor GrpE n=1 Tax=Kineococcus sp. SYSU DK005 TaxID=3383126 RepID=UPI003D7D5F23
MTSNDGWQRFGQAPPETWVPAQPVPEAVERAPSASEPQDEGDAQAPSSQQSNSPNQPDQRPQPEADAGASGTIAASAALAEMGKALVAVGDDLRRLTDVHERQSALVDRLHADNQALRRAETERQRDPLIRELIGLADTSMRTARNWQERDDPAAQPVAEALRGVADDIRLILDHQGFETYDPAPGDTFDRRLHKAKGTRNTSDSTLDECVAEALRPGYRYEERIIRPADVLVWHLAERSEADAAPHVDASSSGDSTSTSTQAPHEAPTDSHAEVEDSIT